MTPWGDPSTSTGSHQIPVSSFSLCEPHCSPGNKPSVCLLTTNQHSEQSQQQEAEESWLCLFIPPSNPELTLYSSSPHCPVPHCPGDRWPRWTQKSLEHTEASQFHSEEPGLCGQAHPKSCLSGSGLGDPQATNIWMYQEERRESPV